MSGARSGKRHPMAVLEQLFGLRHSEADRAQHAGLEYLSTAIRPQDVLRDDAEEGCGVSELLLQQLGCLPIGGERLSQCYEVRLGPTYVSLAQEMCRLPLYCNDALTKLIEELVAAGASCTPPLAQVLASLAKHGPSLNHALYAAEPLALHLRVSLSLLLDLCPPTHPDAQHLRSAMQVRSYLLY